MEQVLELELQHCLMNSIIHSANLAYSAMAEDAGMPSVLYRPKLSLDGNQWCALHGEDLQTGVAGFGDSPYEAMKAFNAAWYEKIPAKRPEVQK